MPSSADQPPASASPTSGRQSQSQSRPTQLADAPPSTSSKTPSNPRHRALAFSFPPLFQSNTSSTSLAPSTAEGRPIPVDDSTAEHRTTALRELNSNFPSRHNYAKSTGAQNSTYSQPVIVRSYYPPLPNRPTNADHGIVIVNGGGAGCRAGPRSEGPASAVRRILPFASRITPTGSGMLSNMVRARMKRHSKDPRDAKLPPVEAFSFKSFMADMEQQSGEININADLDRIAEICAKSRYSLSNQYEVHYAPHGSGASFLGGPGQDQYGQGPTLQAVSSDDEHSMKRQRKRRSGMRRDSRAMGTLETIMSSSRSSDEESSKKMSAADLADEVRGRAARKESGVMAPTISLQSASDDNSSHDEQLPRIDTARRSVSLALIEGARQNLPAGETASPKASSIGLLAQPAVPMTSKSQLELRPAPEGTTQKPITSYVTGHVTSRKGVEQTVAQGDIALTTQLSPRPSLLSALGGWLPWKAAEAFSTSNGRAEGSLRDLLKNTDIKGKGVERVI